MNTDFIKYKGVESGQLLILSESWSWRIFFRNTDIRKSVAKSAQQLIQGEKKNQVNQPMKPKGTFFKNSTLGFKTTILVQFKTRQETDTPSLAK